MMRRLTFVFFFLISNWLIAQQIEPSVISSSGSHSSGTSILLDWTLGEISIQEYIHDDFILTEGFHQADIIISSINMLDTESVRIFPNPTRSNIYIEFEENSSALISLELINNQAQVLWKEQVPLNQLKVVKNLDDLPSGIYYLKVVKNNAIYSNHKIILTRSSK